METQPGHAGSTPCSAATDAASGERRAVRQAVMRINSLIEQINEYTLHRLETVYPVREWRWELGSIAESLNDEANNTESRSG